MAQPNANSSFPITLINNDREKSYMKKDILGKGTFGIVFRGSYRDEEVAVKRLELARLDAADDREVKLQIDLEHDNVLKILSVDEDEDYK
jgi:predicted Ser/Thr protein kinase